MWLDKLKSKKVAEAEAHAYEKFGKFALRLQLSHAGRDGTKDPYKWCADNCKGEYSYIHDYFWFEKDEDAMMFKIAHVCK